MTDDPIRIWRSPYSDFNENETLDADKTYTTDQLETIAKGGFNAVWVRGILRDIARTDVFPELGQNASAHQESLRAVAKRCEETGTQLWLYMQPPQALDPGDPFWDSHPEVKGVTSDRTYKGAKTTLCVSEPQVQEFLRQAATNLSKAIPGLGGAILITASEFMQHCYTDSEDGRSTDCERCAQREPRDVIADIVHSVRNGFADAGNGAQVAAWNWSWNFHEPDPQRGIIEKLPKDVHLMAGFERGDKKEILGETREIDEYALSFAGPSDRFIRSIEAARECGMAGVMAKHQIATTHELATVPNLPVLGAIYEKVKGMHEHDIQHVMGCWNFGNMLSANTAAFTRFLDAEKLPQRDKALMAFATDYLPGCEPATVVDAWETFEDAMDWYPFSIPFLYHGPLNHALVRPIEWGPLDGKPVGRSWLQVERGDDLSRSIGNPYTLSEIITGLGSLWRTWIDGAETFENGVTNCDATTATEEVNSAWVAGHCFRSGWNLYRAYRIRQNWEESKGDELLAIARDERDHLQDVLPVVAADDRMGFHSDPQEYLFTAEGIEAKLRDLEELLAT